MSLGCEVVKRIRTSGAASATVRSSIGKVIVSVRLLEAVGIDVLSQQGDFFITLCHEVGHFIEDAFHITATLTATGVGNDAVSTEIIAPTHDGDEAGDVVSANARGDDIPIGLCGGELHVHCFLTGLYRGNQFGQ